MYATLLLNILLKKVHLMPLILTKQSHVSIKTVICHSHHFSTGDKWVWPKTTWEEKNNKTQGRACKKENREKGIKIITNIKAALPLHPPKAKNEHIWFWNVHAPHTQVCIISMGKTLLIPFPYTSSQITPNECFGWEHALILSRYLCICVWV